MLRSPARKLSQVVPDRRPLWLEADLARIG
jgi:hypothetical protein